jgi:hypothetical protein
MEAAYYEVRNYDKDVLRLSRQIREAKTLSVNKQYVEDFVSYLRARGSATTARQRRCIMAAQTEEEKKAAKLQAYAEALAFFIEEPKAINDPTIALFVEICKDKIALELDKRAKGIGRRNRLKSRPRKLQPNSPRAALTPLGLELRPS